MLECDFDSKNRVSVEMFKQAESLRMHIVRFVCDGVSFVALVRAIPRQGDVIWLEDDRKCRVTEIVHKVVGENDEAGKRKVTILAPTVYAVLVKKTKQE
jgi:hypothetical protein